jgi:hypothetical protein
MRHWAALAGGLLVLPLCLSVALGIHHNAPVAVGTAYMTQGGIPSPQVETNFGDNWDSVRIFHLNSSLKTPLKVYVNNASGLYKPQFRDYVMESLADWSGALDGRLNYVFTNRKDSADITVDWVPSFSDKYVAGLTTYSIGHARVEIRTIGVPEKDIKANIIHEFGHALGIAGHSSNEEDIMVGSRRWRRGDTSYNPKLSGHDIQAIRLLYSPKWRKGEDLYAASAQNRRIIADQNSNVPEIAKN